MNENMQSELQLAPPQLPPSVSPSKVFDTYWRFAADRQEIFFRRIAGAPLGGPQTPYSASSNLRMPTVPRIG